jgi:photosystem II stability/assembly factor-like uncharacterized protein
MVLVILASLEATMSILTRPRPPRSDDPPDVEALEALIEEARQRARRRRRWYGACALVAASAGLLGFYGFNHGGGARPQAFAEDVPGGAAVPSEQVAGWTPARGLERAFIIALAVDPQESRNVYAASREAGVFKSSDGGTTWRPVFAPSTERAGRFDALAIAPGDPEIVYAGTGGGVFKSIDSGATWRAANSGLFGRESAEERQHRLDEGYVTALIVDPGDSETVYAATYGDVFKSTNGGASWRSMGLSHSLVGALVLDPNDPDTMYAGMLGAFAGGAWAKSGVFKSTDGGAGWRPVGLQGRNVSALAVDLAHPEHLYAGTDEHGVFKSTDAGASWHPAGLARKSVERLALDENDPLMIYATTGDGVFKSVDGGGSWRALNGKRAPRAGVTALVLDPRDSATLYAGTAAGVLKSVNDGASWRAINAGLTAYRVRALALDLRTPGTAYAAIEGGGIAKRTGGSWRTVNTTLTVDALAVDPQRPDTVYAGTADPVGIFRSMDGGRSWRRLSAPIPNPKTAVVSALAVDPQSPDTVYANTVDYADFSVAYGGATESGVFKTSDGGATWAAVGGGLPYLGDTGLASPLDTAALALDPLDPETLYAYGDHAGLFKSTNGGATWRRAGLPNTLVDALALDPEESATLYAGTGEGVFKSTDAGESWRAASTGLDRGSVSLLAADPVHPQTVYAATNGGLFRTTDGGRTWRSFGGRRPSQGIDALAIDPTGGTLYVGLYGRGLFELRLTR